MTLTRRSALALSATVPLALGAASCSSGSSDSGGEVTMWMYPVIKDPTVSKEFWEQAAADFSEANPDLTLNIELQPFDKRDEQISAALAANSGPDLVLITPDHAATYLNIGGLRETDDAVADFRDSFFPGTLDAATFDGSLYGVPLFQNVSTAAYNKNVFEEADLALPSTWDEVLAAAPVLAERGVAVMDYLGSQEQTLNLTFYPLLWQAGGTVFTDDGSDIAFDSPEGIAALDFLLELRDMGGLPAEAATQSVAIEGSPLARGLVGIRHTAMIPEVEQMRGALGDDVVVLGPPLTGAVQATYGNPGLLGLTSIASDADLEAANSALAFLTGKEFQASLNEAAGNFPTRQDVELQGPGTDLEAISTALEVANPGEPNPASRQVMAALAPFVQSALSGDITAEEAMTTAATEARGLLERS